jgi:stearoyl-CoA desaturase (delta-9 desaturase)
LAQSQQTGAPVAARLALPIGVDKRRLLWPYVIGVTLYHLLALLALLPWCFSWAGLVAATLGITVFGTLGINLGFHRLLTHRGLTVPRWLEHGLVILGVCAFQDTPARWVAVHRRHHEHSDAQPDPHSPRVNLFWGHIGWMLVNNAELTRLGIFDRYAKDILRDPFYRGLERGWRYAAILLGSWAVFFLLGALGALATGCDAAEALRVGVSLLVWGVFLRTVAVWHITWSVNSFAHRFGSQRFTTGDDSRNNLIVALLSAGEGWHNNHHADPRSARHGRGWREPDQTWACIWLLERLGLARGVARPRR